MVRKQHGRIQWSGWGIHYPGLQLNRTRPNSFTSLHQPPAPTLLQHSSRPATTGPKRTRPFPPWSQIHWWVPSTSYTWPCVHRSACFLTSCPCSVPHSDGDAAETPGVCQLHWIAGAGHFRQPHVLGRWAKRLESSLMASAVSKHCSVQLICTSLFLQKVWESRKEELARTSSQPESKTEKQILPDLSENLVLHCCLNRSFLCLSNLQVAWQYLQLRIVKIGWLWRWDVLGTKCASYSFDFTFVLGYICPFGPKIYLFLFARVPTLHPQDQVAWTLHTKVRLHLDQLAWMQNIMYKMVLRIQP